jgi:Na+/H+ antiporter NhaD/arsenite permease-like protein
MASNIGSTATITGNPQNMIIGGFSRIPCGAFAATLWPVAASGPILTVILIALGYRHEFLTRERFSTVDAGPAHYHGPLVLKSVLVTAAMVVLFFAGQPVAKVVSSAAPCCSLPAGSRPIRFTLRSIGRSS